MQEYFRHICKLRGMSLDGIAYDFLVLKTAADRGAPRWSHYSRQLSQSPLHTHRRTATRSSAHPVAHFSLRSLSLRRGDTRSP